MAVIEVVLLQPEPETLLAGKAADCLPVLR